MRTAVTKNLRYHGVTVPSSSSFVKATNAASILTVWPRVSEGACETVVALYLNWKEATIVCDSAGITSASSLVTNVLIMQLDASRYDPQYDSDNVDSMVGDHERHSQHHKS